MRFRRVGLLALPLEDGPDRPHLVSNLESRLMLAIDRLVDYPHVIEGSVALDRP